jgi:hypothetical protein
MGKRFLSLPELNAAIVWRHAFPHIMVWREMEVSKTALLECLKDPLQRLGAITRPRNIIAGSLGQLKSICVIGLISIIRQFEALGLNPE